MKRRYLIEGELKYRPRSRPPALVGRVRINKLRSGGVGGREAMDEGGMNEYEVHWPTSGSPLLWEEWNVSVYAWPIWLWMNPDSTDRY